jgi:electron-transferring-flavoprotein dehydrogenase
VLHELILRLWLWCVVMWAGREPWTLRNSKPDSAKTRKASEFTPIEYPKPDGQYTFDLLTNLQVGE